MVLIKLKQMLIYLNLDQNQFYKLLAYVKYAVSPRQRGDLFKNSCFHQGFGLSFPNLHKIKVYLHIL